jgi:hypothetical protein
MSFDFAFFLRTKQENTVFAEGRCEQKRPPQRLCGEEVFGERF